MTRSGRSGGLVLASASPRRARLLADAGWSFDVRPTEVDEEVLLQADDPVAGAERVARAKALAARASAREWVLAGDTIVVAADGGLLGKPADRAQAHDHLLRLSGTTHRVITGVALRHGADLRVGSVVTRISMRVLGEREVRDYVAGGEGLGKAGGYAIQATGDRFVTSVDGSWTNVVGLPMELVEDWLTEAAPSRGGEVLG